MEKYFKNKLVSLNGKLETTPFINQGGCGDFAFRVAKYIKRPVFYITFDSHYDFSHYINNDIRGFKHILLKIDDKFYDSNGFHNTDKFKIYSKNGNLISGNTGDYAVRITKERLKSMLKAAPWGWNDTYWYSKSPMVVKETIKSHFVTQ